MHDVLRQRLMRRIESLPDEQVYQVLDFIEFLESKYAERHLQAESTGLQRLAEGLEDKIRKKAMNPATLREAFQLIAAADRVLASVSSAGRQIIDDLGTVADIPAGEQALESASRTEGPRRSEGSSRPGPSRSAAGATRGTPPRPSRGTPGKAGSGDPEPSGSP